METGGEELSGVQAAELGEVVAPETEGLENNGREDDISGLTVREITEKSLAEEKAKTDGVGGEGGEAQKAQGKAQGKTQQVTEPAAVQGDSAPPARLNAQEKEIFNKLPARLKAATARMYKDVDRQSNAHWRQMSEATQAANVITTGVRSYLMERPHLVQQGFTEGRLVNELLAAHMKLENPDTKLQTFADLGRQIGLDAQSYARVGQALGSTQAGSGRAGEAVQGDISGHPVVAALKNQITALQQKLDPVYSAVSHQAQQHEAQVVNSIVSELATVQDEKDALGRYRYPMLHEDSFLDQVKPLVSELKRTSPNLSYGDCLRRAYVALAGPPIGDSIQQNRPGFPASNPNILNRATRAAVSVRGRVAPTASLDAGSQNEAPPEVLAAGTRAVTEWALNRLRSGGTA